jgi:hypothetical protein
LRTVAVNVTVCPLVPWQCCALQFEQSHAVGGLSFLSSAAGAGAIPDATIAALKKALIKMRDISVLLRG